MSIFEPVGDVINLGKNTVLDFENFLTQQNIISLAIATAIGLYINNFITDVMNVIGMPIVNKILGDEKTFGKKYICTVFGVEFELGKLIEIILKLLVTLVIIYFVFNKIPGLLLKINTATTGTSSTTIPVSK